MELLLGARPRLARFAEAMIANGQQDRFGMLLEMARDTLVARWETMRSKALSSHAPDSLTSELLNFYETEFLPVLISVIDLGLVTIKYDSNPMLLEAVLDLLVESFATTSAFNLADFIRTYGGQQLLFSRPAYEIYLGGRVLATYAVLRKRYKFLPATFTRLVKSFTMDRYSIGYKEPFLFWPFNGSLNLPDMRSGRASEYWEQRIGLSLPNGSSPSINLLRCQLNLNCYSSSIHFCLFRGQAQK